MSGDGIRRDTASAGRFRSTAATHADAVRQAGVTIVTVVNLPATGIALPS